MAVRKSRQAPQEPLSKTDRKVSVNTRLDDALVQVVDEFRKRNRKAGTRSDVIENELIELIARKGRKYGLRVPEHLL